MSFCSHCGKEIEDGAAVCTQCGYMVVSTVVKPKEQNPVVTQKSFGAIKAFMIIGTIFTSLVCYLIPLVWCIPMTVSFFNKAKYGQKCSTAFKICTLLFVNQIAGILLLCDRDI